jgi:hypothetical protein
VSLIRKNHDLSADYNLIAIKESLYTDEPFRQSQRCKYSFPKIGNYAPVFFFAANLYILNVKKREAEIFSFPSL